MKKLKHIEEEKRNKMVIQINKLDYRADAYDFARREHPYRISMSMIFFFG